MKKYIIISVNIFLLASGAIEDVVRVALGTVFPEIQPVNELVSKRAISMKNSWEGYLENDSQCILLTRYVLQQYAFQYAITRSLWLGLFEVMPCTPGLYWYQSTTVYST